MLKKLLMVIAVLMPSCLLMVGNTAHAAYFQVSTSDSYPAAPPTTWNPRAAGGLFAVMSEATSFNYDGSYIDDYGKYVNWTLKGAAAAATYGSDTSTGDGILDPRLLGYSVEPMADTQASASMECTRDGAPYSPCGALYMAAGAGASVNHRVFQRGDVVVSEELQVKLDKLDYVPAYVDYTLSATASNADLRGGRASLATAGFAMGALNVIVTTNPYSSCPPNARCFLNEHSEHVNLWLAPSTVDRTVTFLIGASANVSAVVRVDLGDPILDASAQAVADPFLYIDPTWKYAPYFMVQQESLLHPGEWAEVTRIWTQPIPEPETYAMMLAGLCLVAIVVRRRKQT
ncbi:MAG: PEP-CTERM sorting domain-containing protein [Sulfuritalea sp.]|nr:PEP-CTERM sorting domain-containing protein [Sulfuritalea sp.]